MMTCPTCQLEFSEPVPAYCPRCGAALSSDSAQPSEMIETHPSPAQLAAAAPPKRSIFGIIMTVLSLAVVATVLGMGTIGAVKTIVQKKPLPAAPSISVATPLPPRNETFSTILNDPMTSANSGWPNQQQCLYKADGYHVSQGEYCRAPVDQFDDGIISVTTKQITGDPNWYYGVFFRSANWDNYYVFIITSNGYWKFSQYYGQHWSDLTPDMPSTAIHKGLDVTNTIKVEMRQAELTFFINGAKVDDLQDVTFSSGYCGVVGGNNIEVVYTNFLAQASTAH